MDEKNVNVPENENIDEEDNNIVVLKNEDGEKEQFEFLDLIEYGNESYVVLLPLDVDEDSDEPQEVLILKEDKESEDGENEEYVSVDDEDTLNTVFQMFKDKFKDEFSFGE